MLSVDELGFIRTDIFAYAYGIYLPWVFESEKENTITELNIGRRFSISTFTCGIHIIAPF